MTKFAQVFRAGPIDSKETTIYCVRWSVPVTEDNKRGFDLGAYKSLHQLPEIIHAVCKMEGVDVDQTTDLFEYVSFVDYPAYVRASKKQYFNTEPLTDTQRKELRKLCEGHTATHFWKERLWKRLLPSRWLAQ